MILGARVREGAGSHSRRGVIVRLTPDPTFVRVLWDYEDRADYIDTRELQEA